MCIRPQGQPKVTGLLPTTDLILYVATTTQPERTRLLFSRWMKLSVDHMCLNTRTHTHTDTIYTVSAHIAMASGQVVRKNGWTELTL